MQVGFSTAWFLGASWCFWNGRVIPHFGRAVTHAIFDFIKVTVSSKWVT
jgi:hypothetical protein